MATPVQLICDACGQLAGMEMQAYVAPDGKRIEWPKAETEDGQICFIIACPNCGASTMLRGANPRLRTLFATPNLSGLPSDYVRRLATFGGSKIRVDRLAILNVWPLRSLPRSFPPHVPAAGRSGGPFRVRIRPRFAGLRGPRS